MIRAAGLEDLERVLEVERRCATAPHWGVEEYRKIVEGAGVVRRCLLVADGVAGFAVGKAVGDVGELESVSVEEAARGRGLGRELCAGVVDWCRGEGAAVVELEVRVGSLGVRKLYEGLGFVEVGRRVGYYAGPVEDAVLMRLAL